MADAGLKPTNPKDLIGSNKVPLGLWPSTATAMGCMGMLDGALKYGRSNWRAAGIRTSVYVDAILRHALALWEGEDIDPDSGLPHEAHLLATVAILVDARAAGKALDDRPIRGGYRKLIDKLTVSVAALREKHADKHPHHYTLDEDPAGFSALNDPKEDK